MGVRSKLPVLDYVGDVYRPSDDTWLLIEVLEERKPVGDLCLDLGAGSGIIGIYALLNRICKRVVFVDVTEDSAESIRINASMNKVDHLSIIVLSDNIMVRNGSMDLVVANPPYLPIQDLSSVDVTTEGGVEGYELILYFLDFAKEVLKPGGSFYLVYSSLSKPDVVLSHIRTLGLKIKRTKYKRFFYETIYAVECAKPW